MYHMLGLIKTDVVLKCVYIFHLFLTIVFNKNRCCIEMKNPPSLVVDDESV